MTTYPAPWITLGATGHGSCWGARPPGQQAGAIGHAGRQCQASRPGAMDHAGRHGPWAMLGHRQQQAGAVGHAGRHRPWAMLGHQQQASRPAGRAHRASGIGHGPCWAPAAAGRRHGSRRAPARAAPGGQHQHQAGTVDQAGYQLGQRLVNGTSSSRPARRAPVPGQHAGRHRPWAMLGHQASTRPAPGRHRGSGRAPARATPGEQHQQQAGRHRPWAMLWHQAGAMNHAGRHGSCWGARPPGQQAGAIGHAGRQCQASRPGAMDHAGRHGPWAMLGHRQQQAGAVGHAGRHRPWAMLGHQQQASRPAGRAHRASGIGHGPCWAPAAAGRRHGSRRAPARAAPGGQHQHQAGTVDQAGYQLGQRLVNGTSSSRPARRAPVPGQHAGRHRPWAMLGHQASRPAPWIRPGASSGSAW